ncbi:MAG TPA: serine hydrolase [Pyrinomonadaceae bacterium]|jgi:CubicO group peptidase (beta-lactamase class C family)|nr:serine hydrolase [Pyrinomonadaceae bacterium]
MRRSPARLSLLLLVLLSLAPAPLAQSLDERLREIDEYAARAGRDWNVPGFAVAVVKDDKVVFAKGYGVRELGKPEAVDKDTLFAIASNTKAFTSAALATLVDEGKLKWDDPVTKYLPYFQLYDAYATREMTVRDLVSHRSGLATFGGDLLWFETTYPREEIIRRVRHLRPAYSFRSRYGYQNIMFLAAGEIVPAVTGKSWDDYVREKFFAPLRMTRTTTSHKQLLQTPNIATPHNELRGKLRVIHYDDVDNAGGAAAISSSVADMAQWLRLQLGRGAYEGRAIFSPRQSREMWTPHTVVGGVSEAAERFNPTAHFNLYGLGWFLGDYHGRKVVSHGGGLDGMISRVALMPEESLGLVVLTNSETPLSSVISNKIFDTFLGVPKRDWSADYLKRRDAGRAAEEAEEKKVEAARAANTKPSLPLEAYAGTYTGVMFGDAKVAVENGRLVVRLAPSPNFVGDLEHWHYDTFSIRWRDSIVYPFGRGFVTFNLDARGQVDEMKIDVPNPDFDFKELEFKRAPAER